MHRQSRAGVVTALWLVLAAHGCSGQLNEAQVHYCGVPCPEGGASASLDMSLRGSGAHRELIYRLAIACPTAHPSRGSSASSVAVKGSSASVPSPPVRAALLQPLPAGVFADIYQLDNAAALGQGPPVQLFGHVDVESIERYSKPTVLAVLCGGSAAMAADQASLRHARCLSPKCFLCSRGARVAVKLAICAMQSCGPSPLPSSSA